jgi:hypothetical protein
MTIRSGLATVLSSLLQAEKRKEQASALKSSGLAGKSLLEVIVVTVLAGREAGQTL